MILLINSMSKFELFQTENICVTRSVECKNYFDLTPCKYFLFPCLVRSNNQWRIQEIPCGGRRITPKIRETPQSDNGNKNNYFLTEFPFLHQRLKTTYFFQLSLITNTKRRYQLLLIPRQCTHNI